MSSSGTRAHELAPLAAAGQSGGVAAADGAGPRADVVGAFGGDAAAAVPVAPQLLPPPRLVVEAEEEDHDEVALVPKDPQRLPAAAGGRGRGRAGGRAREPRCTFRRCCFSAASWTRLSGLGFMCMASLVFSVMALVVHSLKDRVPDMEISAVRFLWMWLFSVISCVYRNESVWGPRDARLRVGLAVRGLLGTLGMSCYFYSLTHMPLAEATTLSFTFPMWTAVFGSLMLRERLGVKDGATLLACVGGVLLIARPVWLFGCAHIDMLFPYARPLRLTYFRMQRRRRRRRRARVPERVRGHCGARGRRVRRRDAARGARAERAR